MSGKDSTASTTSTGSEGSTSGSDTADFATDVETANERPPRGCASLRLVSLKVHFGDVKFTTVDRMDACLLRGPTVQGYVVTITDQFKNLVNLV